MKCPSFFRFLPLLSAMVSLSGIMASAAEPVAADDFSADSLSPKWAAVKGEWKIQAGQLNGAEVASDEHAAVLTYRAPHKDSKVSLSFELAGSEGFHLSFNHAKGHLFRVLVSGDEIIVRTDKDKKDPASKPETVGKAEISLTPGKRHQLTCETKGENVIVTLDDEVKIEGSHPALATAKTGYRLIVKGEGVIFDDFAISHLE